MQATEESGIEMKEVKHEKETYYGDNIAVKQNVYIIKDVKVPPKTTLEVMQGNKLVVQNDGSNADVLRAEASAGSAIDVTISVLEDV